jgi:hypothetical protein
VLKNAVVESQIEQPEFRNSERNMAITAGIFGKKRGDFPDTT